MNITLVKAIVFTIVLIAQLFCIVKCVYELRCSLECLSVGSYDLQVVINCVLAHIRNALVYIIIVISLCAFYEVLR